MSQAKTFLELWFAYSPSFRLSLFTRNSSGILLNWWLVVYYHLMHYTAFALLTLLFASIAFGQDNQVQFSQEEQQWIAEHPVIEFGYEPNWPPYEIYEDGEYKGIVGDYVLLLEEATGIDFVPIPNITWEESFKQLGTGEINMVPCAGITKERKQNFLITDPHILDPLVVVTRQNFRPIKGVADLAGSKVALPQSYYTFDLIENDYPDLNITAYSSPKECLRAVSTGETDAFIGSLGVTSYYINHNGFTNLKVSASTPYVDSRFGLAVTKDWGTFKDIAQKVFDNITPQEKNEIRNKWISVRYEHTTNNDELIEIVVYISLGAFGLLLLFYMWNRTLKREIDKRKTTENQLEISLDQIKKQNEEKGVLLKEIHHRVKNNLQIVTSILRLQANKSEDEKIVKSLAEASERVHSISLIHGMIFENESLAKINLKNYLNKLIQEISSSFGENVQSTIRVQSENQELDMKSLVPLALIFNELITNSLKYAFQDQEDGSIDIEVNQDSDQLKVNYRDNGTWVPPSSHSGFGLSLIDIFTEQLEGSYTTNTENGTVYFFKFTLV